MFLSAESDHMSSGPAETHLLLVAVHLLLQELLTAHLLQLLPQELTRLLVRLDDGLSLVICDRTRDTK